MSDKTERAMSIVLTACALLFAGILLKREFVDRDAVQRPGLETTPPEQVANWEELLAHGLSLRSPDAPIIVVEFADLECPACKQFHTRFSETVAEMQAEVGLVMLHYPLSIHRFANAAARALECADSQGAASRFVDLAYAKQDSFGLKPWVDYAQEAGVRDTSVFGACVRGTATIDRLEQGTRIAASMNVRGTPTVIINGWRFSSPPSDAQLRGTIKALLAGKTPPDA